MNIYFINLTNAMKHTKRGIKENKAQVSIEYIMILGFVTFVVISILGVAIFYTGSVKDRIKGNYINNYGNKIISTSEYVFYSGEPSKATITCYLPEGVRSISVISNSIVIEFSTSSGINKIAFDSDAPIQPGTNVLTASPGLKRIEITAYADRAEINQVY